MGIQIIEKAKSRNEEEDRDAEPGKNLKKSREMGIGSGVLYIQGAHMDADDTHHRDAADIFDGGEARFFHKIGKYSFLCANYQYHNGIFSFCKAERSKRQDFGGKGTNINNVRSFMICRCR